MANLSDILTTAQNIASAINGIAQTYLNVQGIKNTAGITAAKLVSVVSAAPNPPNARLARVSVIVAGSVAGTIYDANNVTATTNPIYVIPMTVGVFEVNFPLSFGLVVVPGTGQTVSVSYS
jgi:hypothetical protein